MAGDQDPDRKLRRFAGQIAHELNNALTGVLGLAEILQQRTDLGADPRAQIDSIARHSRRLKVLGEKLVDFSRSPGADPAELPDLRGAESERAARRAGRDANEKAVVGKTALLVEDEEVVRTVLTWQLQEMGLRVDVAASAEEALDMVAAGAAVDIAIVDLVLPGRSGLDLAATLHGLRPALPVLMLSGRGAMAVEKVDSFRAWLVKPVDPDELRRVVRDHLPPD